MIMYFYALEVSNFFVETLPRRPIPCCNEQKLNVTFNGFAAVSLYGEGEEWAKSPKVVPLWR